MPPHDDSPHFTAMEPQKTIARKMLGMLLVSIALAPGRVSHPNGGMLQHPPGPGVRVEQHLGALGERGVFSARLVQIAPPTRVVNEAEHVPGAEAERDEGRPEGPTAPALRIPPGFGPCLGSRE